MVPKTKYGIEDRIIRIDRDITKLEAEITKLKSERFKLRNSLLSIGVKKLLGQHGYNTDTE